MTRKISVEKTPERELRTAMEILRLSKEGTIDSHVIKMRATRAEQAAQPRKRVQ